jgi:hypothetical protein
LASGLEGRARVVGLDYTALLTVLAKAHAEGRLEDRLAFCAKPKLLNITSSAISLRAQGRAPVLSTRLRPYERGDLR